MSENHQEEPFFSWNKGSTCLPTAIILVGSNYHPHHHWYSEVLYKRFLTPSRDGVLNRPLVSDCDRGGPSHTTQKPLGICPPGTHARENEVVCDRRAIKYGYMYSSAKKYNYTGEIISSCKYIPHIQSPLNVFVRIYIPHSRSKEKVSVRRYITHNFPR